MLNAMKIAIDARFYGSIGKGLGRYTQKLIENLEELDFTNEYVIFLRRENWDEYQPRNSNFSKVLADIKWYTLKEQFAIPKIIKKHKPDLVHFPHFNIPIFYRKPFVVTIHDLILFHFPTKKATTLSSLKYFFKKIGHRLVITNAVKKSRKIIAVSNNTKKDILNYFSVSPNKIEVTYEAVDIRAKPNHLLPEWIIENYGIIKPYILYVGNSYPHKNLERLVLAFKILKKRHPNLKLVLVGKEDYFYRRLKKFVYENQAKDVIFTGYVEDDDLPAVYREALAYVFPSLYEGFGLPPLEAMARRTPVIASKSSCIPEILGNAAEYFEGRAVSEMAEKIEAVITDKQRQAELIAAGEKQVQKYSWRKLAEQTLEIYLAAAKGDDYRRHKF